MNREARRLTKQGARAYMRSVGAHDESVGEFVHRLRAAGLSDDRVGRMLGASSTMARESVRRALNRWEAADGLHTDVDSQARANVTHANSRLQEAGGWLWARVPDHVDPVHLTLEADLDLETAELVEVWLGRLVDVLEAEITANVLNLPRNVMPGARPVAWDEIRNRIRELRAQVHEAKRREIVARYVEDGLRRRRVMDELLHHEYADEIIAVLADRTDAASGDALGHLTTAPSDAVLAILRDDGSRIRPRRRQLVWPERRHICHDRDDPELMFEQRAGDVRIASRCKDRRRRRQRPAQ